MLHEAYLGWYFWIYLELPDMTTFIRYLVTLILAGTIWGIYSPFSTSVFAQEQTVSINEAPVSSQDQVTSVEENVEPQTEDLSVKAAADYDPQRKVADGENEPEQRFAILIGIQDYQNGLSKLQYCNSDMVHLERALLGGGFKKGEIVLMTDSSQSGELRPLKSNIMSQIKGITSRITSKNSFLLIAFSGHGFQDKDNNRYLCSLEANLADPTHTMISLEDDIYPLLTDNDKLKSCTLLLDACRVAPHRGPGDSDTQTQLSYGDDRKLANLPDKLSVISSCQKGTVSMEDPELKQGVFMYHIARGLEGPAKNYQGEVNNQSLYDYVEAEMGHYTSRKGRTLQKPTILHNVLKETTDIIPIAVPQGISYWPMRPDSSKNELSSAYADLVQLPGLSGQWWFDEIPWYLPFVRLSVAKRISNAQDINEVSIFHLDSFNADVTNRLNYHSSDVSEVYAWLYKKMMEPCRKDYLTSYEMKLIDSLLELSQNNTKQWTVESYAQKIKDIQSLYKKESENKVDGAIQAIRYHSLAVLGHKYCMLANKKGKAEEAIETNDYYKTAIKYYQGIIDEKIDEKNVAPHVFLHLCRMDYARFLKEVEDNIAACTDQFELIRRDSYSGRATGISSMFRLETNTTFANYNGSENPETEVLFRNTESLLRNDTTLKPDHPLRAYFFERRAWNLLYAWKARDAEDAFAHAMKIRDAYGLNSSDPFAQLYVLHNQHGIAMAKRYQGYLNKSETYGESKTNTVHSIAGANSIFAEVLSQLEKLRNETSSSTTNAILYQKMLKERYYNSNERWGDCALYGGAAALIPFFDKREAFSQVHRVNELKANIHQIPTEMLYARAINESQSEGVCLVFASKLALLQTVIKKPEQAEQLLAACEERLKKLHEESKKISDHEDRFLPQSADDGKLPIAEKKLVTEDFVDVNAIVDHLENGNMTIITLEDRTRASLICTIARIVLEYDQKCESVEGRNEIYEKLQSFLRYFNFYSNHQEVAKSEITELRLFVLEFLLNAKLFYGDLDDIESDMVFLDSILNNFTNDYDRFQYSRRYFDLAIRICHKIISLDDNKRESPSETVAAEVKLGTELDGIQAAMDIGQSERKNTRLAIIRLARYLLVIERQQKFFHENKEGNSRVSRTDSPFSTTPPPALVISCQYLDQGEINLFIPSDARLPLYEIVKNSSDSVTVSYPPANDERSEKTQFFSKAFQELILNEENPRLYRIEISSFVNFTTQEGSEATMQPPALPIP